MQPTTAKPPKVRQGSAVHDEMAADFHGNPHSSSLPNKRNAICPHPPRGRPPHPAPVERASFLLRHIRYIITLQMSIRAHQTFLPSSSLFFPSCLHCSPSSSCVMGYTVASRSAVHRSTVVSPDTQPTIIIRQCFSPSSSTTRVIQGKALPVSN